MKRVCVLILLLASGLLVPLAPSRAADLQAGWYANIVGIEIWLYGPEGGYRPGPGGSFYTEGQYGPFLVTNGSYYGKQYVSVPTNAYGVGPDQTLVLPVSFPGIGGELIAQVLVDWQTNYDPNQMRLELWRERDNGSQELMWTQLQAGVKWGSRGTGYDTYAEGPYYFKINVLPEPTGVASLLLGLGGLSVLMRRRRADQ